MSDDLEFGCLFRGLKQYQGNIHEHEVHCSRERSRAASKIIEEVIKDKKTFHSGDVPLIFF